MKTKFIKVAVSEKRPEKGEVYFTYDKNLEKSTRLFDRSRRKFFGITQPLEYLLEVPDREDEMREMLEEILDHIKEYPHEPIGWAEDKIEQLLNELKQTT
ncbi:hypothetical protein [Chryseobacterium daeguense]|uniref:hypothetical protein n=1 Tax=Chryseobacterium daeguense TaxID=412438 RepID=UPI0003FB7571|nr:hypothetical protein [Chryseobacterium daeguense]